MPALGRFLVASLAALSSFASIRTADAQRPAMPPVLDSALVSYFQGSWQCEGKFANGKAIASTETFTPDLDRHWLRVVHDDRPPNQYHALSMWGADGSSGRFVAMIFDNFGGARRFTSAGWDGRALVLTGAPAVAAPTASAPSPNSSAARMERFTYATESSASYRMRYEVSADDGATWRLGDQLVCTR